MVWNHLTEDSMCNLVKIGQAVSEKMFKDYMQIWQAVSEKMFKDYMQIWPSHEKVQCQPRVIICTNLVDFESPKLSWF